MSSHAYHDVTNAILSTQYYCTLHELHWMNMSLWARRDTSVFKIVSMLEHCALHNQTSWHCKGFYYNTMYMLGTDQIPALIPPRNILWVITFIISWWMQIPNNNFIQVISWHYIYGIPPPTNTTLLISTLFLYVGTPNIPHCAANEWLLQNHIQYVFNVVIMLTLPTICYTYQTLESSFCYILCTKYNW